MRRQEEHRLATFVNLFVRIEKQMDLGSVEKRVRTRQTVSTAVARQVLTVIWQIRNFQHFGSDGGPLVMTGT